MFLGRVTFNNTRAIASVLAIIPKSNQKKKTKNIHENRLKKMKFHYSPHDYLTTHIFRVLDDLDLAKNLYISIEASF